MERIDEKKQCVLQRFRELGNVVVALSGGVDSATLLALAVEALGPDRVLAATGRSPAVPERDLEDARRVCERLGVDHRVVDTREIEDPSYRRNGGDRCYHCRTELFAVLGRLARQERIPWVAYGAIEDDKGDFRPGMRAADEAAALAPLLEAGIDKAEVRVLAARAGLEVQDKPAAACLASRIPVGIEVTPERLAQIGRAEAQLAALGFRQFRVRHHDEIARVELDDAGLARLADPAVRAEMVARLSAAGYRFVTVDLAGYRTGSLNPAQPPTLYRIQPVRESGQ